MQRITRALTVASVLLLASCGGDGATGGTTTEPQPRPEAQLTFLRPAAGASLSRDSVSFWVVGGQDREVEMFYRPRAGRPDSVRFLRFRVRGNTVVVRPNGTPLANGDSLRITIRILDFSRLITQFQPSGLTFGALRPAELRLDFRNCDQDFNRDGSVDPSDAALVANFAIWKQENAGQPWQRLSGDVEVSGNLSEVRADVVSFTNHAIAF
jgi:hypothetical protein